MFKYFLFRFAKPQWLCLWLMVYSSKSYADLEFLDAQLASSENKIIIAAEFSYFDISLDFLDFASKVNSASTPERSTSSQVSVLYNLNQDLKLGYEYKTYSARITRTVEPFETETTGDKHQILAKHKIGAFRDHPIYFNASASYVEQDNLEIDCYSHSGLVLGGSCDGADIRLLDGPTYFNTGERNYYPALTAEASAQVYKLGIEFEGKIFGTIPFYQKLEYQHSKTDVRYASALLEIDDPVLLNASFRGIALGDTIANLVSQLPQQTPWTETALIIEAGSQLRLSQSIVASASVKHYKISRKNYEYGASETNYDNNTVLNLALWYELGDSFMIYLRGELSSHNLLGMDPLAYNRKTSKFFAQPQGQVSLGLVLTF